MKKKGDCFRSIDENIAFAGPLWQYKTKINNNKLKFLEGGYRTFRPPGHLIF